MPKVVVGLGLELIGLPWLAIGLNSQDICGTHVKMVASDNIYIYIYIYLYLYLLGAEFFGHLKYWDLFGF